MAGPVERPPASVSPQVDLAIGRATRALWGKLWPVMLTTVLGGLVAGYIQFRAALAEVDQLKALRGIQQKEILELQSDVAKLKVQEQARAEYDPQLVGYIAAVLEETQGVKIQRGAGAPPLPQIETATPFRRGARVTAQPVTTVKTPPPTPPTQ